MSYVFNIILTKVSHLINKICCHRSSKGGQVHRLILLFSLVVINFRRFFLFLQKGFCVNLISTNAINILNL